MYRSRTQISLDTITGLYAAAGTTERVSQSISAQLHDTLILTFGHDSGAGSPKVKATIEGSSDGANWAAIHTVNDIVFDSNKVVAVEHVPLYVRIKFSLTSGTSITVNWVNAELIT
ncbi:hypothetical protein KJZ99_04110 [bacterium]|nr:hypothetical protein [bacterium]